MPYRNKNHKPTAQELANDAVQHFESACFDISSDEEYGMTADDVHSDPDAVSDVLGDWLSWNIKDKKLFDEVVEIIRKRMSHIPGDVFDEFKRYK